MDFGWNETQKTLRDLAREVFTDLATHDRLKELEAESATIFDRDLWASVAQAGLLGIVVPEEHGGAGLGLMELLPVLEEQGRTVAPIPLVPTLVLGALPVAQFGSGELQAALLPGVATGEVVLTAALDESIGGELRQPSITATREGDAWSLNGTAPFVPYAAQANRILVPATSSEGVVIVVVDPAASGIEITEHAPTNRQPEAAVAFNGSTATDLLVGPDDGAAALDWIVQRGAAAVCAVQSGVCEGAIRMTAAYTSERKQFDKRIAEFQAVAQRAADAFIDTEMLTLTTRAAIFRLANGLDAQKEVHVAKFWAGDGAMRVVHAAQHLHGGIGVDLDYPVHRYFMWAKRNEHLLGTPTRELIKLGDLLADQAV